MRIKDKSDNKKKGIFSHMKLVQQVPKDGNYKATINGVVFINTVMYISFTPISSHGEKYEEVLMKMDSNYTESSPTGSFMSIFGDCEEEEDFVGCMVGIEIKLNTKDNVTYRNVKSVFPIEETFEDDEEEEDNDDSYDEDNFEEEE